MQYCAEQLYISKQQFQFAFKYIVNVFLLFFKW